MRVRHDMARISEVLKPKGYEVRQQEDRLAWWIFKGKVILTLTYSPHLKTFKLYPYSEALEYQEVLEVVASQWQESRQESATRYQLALTPWVVVRLLPQCQRIVVARFRKRNDAEEHLRTLRFIIPQAKFVVLFEPPQKEEQLVASEQG